MSVTVLKGDGNPRNVYIGPFWSTGVNLNRFLWEAWVRFDANHTGYWISGGRGGNHPLLAGFAGASPSGNIYTGSGSTSFTGDYTAEAGEWMHYDELWDGTTVFVRINGIVVGTVAFAGPRRADMGELYLFGSDHNNLNGAIAQVRGFEMGNPIANPAFPFTPERHFGRYYVQTASPASFLMPMFNAGPFLPDMGVFEGVAHPGHLTAGSSAQGNNGLLDAAPLAAVADATAPFFDQYAAAQVRTPPTPPATPGGAKIFDSFSRADQLLAYTATPTLGSTEAGSLGAKAWQSAPSVYWQLQEGRCCGQTNGNYQIAHVASDSADMDVRVDRRLTANVVGGAFGWGLAARVQDTANGLVLFPVSSTSAWLGTLTAGSFAQIAAYTFNSARTTFRIVTSGTTVTVYTDNGAGGWTQIGQATGVTAFQAETKAGIFAYGTPDTRYRVDNFTVL